MSHYKHLSITERESIWEGMLQGKKAAQIARALQRSTSTVTREVKRNSYQVGKGQAYRPSTAQRKYGIRRLRCRRHRILNDEKLREMVRGLILERSWSPEQISKRLKLEGSEYAISYPTIYRWLKEGDVRSRISTPYYREMVLHLRHRGKKRHKKGVAERRGKRVIQYRLCERPEEANQRAAIGHWEADTIQGKINSGCVLTMVDRKSRFLIAGKAKRKFACDVSDVLCAVLKGLPPGSLKSITPDLGTEFSRYACVTRDIPEAKFYFPHPHSPWERPTSENTNGLLRQFIPARSDLSALCDDLLQSFVSLLNHRPRKCLGWLSPFEVFFHSSLRLI